MSTPRLDTLSKIRRAHGAYAIHPSLGCAAADAVLGQFRCRATDGPGRCRVYQGDAFATARRGTALCNGDRGHASGTGRGPLLLNRCWLSPSATSDRRTASATPPRSVRTIPERRLLGPLPARSSIPVLHRRSRPGQASAVVSPVRRSPSATGRTCGLRAALSDVCLDREAAPRERIQHGDSRRHRGYRPTWADAEATSTSADRLSAEA